MSHPVEGLPLEIKFIRETITLFLHPDGVAYSNSALILAKKEAIERAFKRVKKISLELNAGTIDADEYDAELKELDKQKAEMTASLTERKSKGEFTQSEYDVAVLALEKDYRENLKALASARDGKPCAPEENERLEKDFEYWLEKANFSPIAVPYLRSCVVGWIRSNEEKSPATFDDLGELTEDQLKVAFTKVTEFYGERSKAEKKSTENLTDDSQTLKPEKETPLNGSLSSESPEPTELIPMTLPIGESESLNAQSQN